MAGDECSAINDFINSRINLAIHKMDGSDPRYQEVCKKQENSWKSIDTILQKLEKGERHAVLRYYEDEVHKLSLESNGVYLQGIKDCFSVLAFFDALGGPCPRRTSQN